MPTLPTPGGDYDSWGTELNEFLEVAHAADGNLSVPADRSVVVVAASDSLARQAAFADYVCDGTADQVQINAALTAAAALSTPPFPATIAPGCTVLLLPGTYYLSDAVDFSNVATVAHIPVTFDAEAAVFVAAANMTSMFVVGYLGGSTSWLENRLVARIGTIEGMKGTYTVDQAVYMTRCMDNRLYFHGIQNVSGNAVTADASAAMSAFMGVFNNTIEIPRIYNCDNAFEVLSSTNVFQFQGNDVRVGDVSVCASGFVIGSATNDYSFWNIFHIGSIANSTGNAIEDKCGRNTWIVGCTTTNTGDGITCPAGLLSRSTFILGGIDDTISADASLLNLIICDGRILSNKIDFGDNSTDPTILFHSGAVATSYDTAIYSNSGTGSPGGGVLHLEGGLVALDSGPLFTNAGIESTGAGSAALGANSPAVTNTAPYTWIELRTSDGSVVYVPAWK
jgi:hypothetical protein